MASRTNKRGIAAKKVQQQKQASIMKGVKRHDYPKRKTSIEQGKEYGFIVAKENPKGNTYHWFFK